MDDAGSLRALLARPAVEVAPDLLGWTLRHTTSEGTVALQVTEVEAYAGDGDPASHAYRGKTSRNAVMFAEAGRLYVYLSYGIHSCANVVTGPPGHASAVLLRAGKVVEGTELARARRGERTRDRSLARGPGCLCQALGVDRTHNGVDLVTSRALSLSPGDPVAPERVSTGHRVGVSTAHDVPWRFWISGDATVSAYKRSPRAVD